MCFLPDNYPAKLSHITLIKISFRYFLIFHFKILSLIRKKFLAARAEYFQTNEVHLLRHRSIVVNNFL